MKAILLLYMTKQLHMSDQSAGSALSWFKTGVYVLPLLGGLIADRMLGRYWTIVGFSIPYILGHFILGIEEQWALFCALVLLAGGSGVIKPNISTLMGLTYDQQRPGQEQLRASAFMWFYFAVNIGAFLSQTALPFLRDKFGYIVAFQFPAWFMVGALAAFAAGKKYYAVEKNDQRQLSLTELIEQLKLLRPLFAIFFFIIFFWVVYEQNDTQWILFVRDHVNLPKLPIIDWQIEADYLQWINPLLVVIFVPIFNGAFKRIDPHAQTITPIRKMLVGFVLTTAAVGLMTIAGNLATEIQQKVSLAWYVAAFSTLTVGEILIFGTGLEMAYAYAPPQIKSLITACFILTAGIANFVNTILAQYYTSSIVQTPEGIGRLPPGKFFGAMTVVMVLATFGFYFAGRNFDRHVRAKKAAVAG